MPNEGLDEREFELINIIGAEIGANQRRLSRLMDLSLGMTNILIRRLVTKGHIRIRQLDKRKVEYLLTPKGFAEKTHKSIKYTLKTINSIGLIKNRIRRLLQDLYKEGERNFILFGESDLIALIEIILNENQFQDCTAQCMDEFPSEGVDGVLLICKEDIEDGAYESNRRIDLIKELSKDIVPMNVSNAVNNEQMHN